MSVHFNIAMVGPPKVGKSEILEKLNSGFWLFPRKICVFYYEILATKKCKIRVYLSILSSSANFKQKFDAIIGVHDVSNDDSRKELYSILNTYEQSKKIIFANKSDLITEKKSLEDEELISAKDERRLHVAFINVIRRLIEDDYPDSPFRSISQEEYERKEEELASTPEIKQCTAEESRNETTQNLCKSIVRKIARAQKSGIFGIRVNLSKSPEFPAPKEVIDQVVLQFSLQNYCCKLDGSTVDFSW